MSRLKLLFKNVIIKKLRLDRLEQNNIKYTFYLFIFFGSNSLFSQEDYYIEKCDILNFLTNEYKEDFTVLPIIQKKATYLKKIKSIEKFIYKANNVKYNLLVEEFKSYKNVYFSIGKSIEQRELFVSYGNDIATLSFNSKLDIIFLGLLDQGDEKEFCFKLINEDKSCKIFISILYQFKKDKLRFVSYIYYKDGIFLK